MMHLLYQSNPVHANLSRTLSELVQVLRARHEMICHYYKDTPEKVTQSKNLLEFTMKLEQSWKCLTFPDKHYEKCNKYTKKILEKLIEDDKGYALQAAVKVEAHRIHAVLLDNNHIADANQSPKQKNKLFG
jgi:uncharacterized protein YyaL (SSP411 family)